MALDKQVIPIPFSGGVDTKTDPLQVGSNKLLLLENAKFQTAKSLRKVWGDAPLSTNVIGGGTITNAVQMATFNNELVLNDGADLYSYSTDSQAWSNKGQTFTVALENVYPVVRNNYAQINQDSATHPSGLQVFAWEDSSGGVRYSVIDSTTQLQIVSNALVSANANTPKVISLGNYILIIVFSGVALNYYAIPVVTPNVLPLAVNIASNVNPSAPLFDASVINFNAFIAYNNSSGGISVRFITPSLSQSALRTVSGDPASGAITVFGDASYNVWVAYYNGAAVKYFIFAYALPATPLLTAHTIETISSVRNLTGVVNGTTATIFYEVAATGVTNPIAQNLSSNTTYPVSATTYFIGQSFLAESTAPLSLAIFNLALSGFLAGNLYAQVFTDNAGVPGTLIETSQAYNSAFILSAGGNVPFAFSGTKTLTYGTTYHIVLNTTTMNFASGTFSVLASNTNPYPSGTAEASSNSGATYAAISGADLYFQVNSSVNEPYNTVIRANTATLSGTAGTPYNVLRSVGLGSKAFVYGNNIFMLAAYQSPLQPTYFLINQMGVVALKLAPSTGGGLTNKSTLPQINPVTSTTFQVSYLEQDFFATVSGVNFFLTGVQQAIIDMNPTNIQSVSIGNNLLTTGGFLSSYDGISSVESGFHLFPENPTIVTSPTGGALSDGQYQYCTVFAWTDNFGQINRSAPSIAQSITTASGGANTSMNVISAPTLRITAKKAPVRSNVWIELYRTEANLPIFYLVSSISAPTYNSTTSDYVTFTDTAADSTIIGNIQLYTTGGVIENIAPPAPSLIWLYNSRVILVPAEANNTWWYSKSVVPGTAVAFTDAFVNNMDSRGGPITAGAQMDSENVFFKGPSDIFYVTGQGPTPNGLNNDWSQPVRIPTGAGCIDPNSVLLMPNGLFYKSMQGFYLLSRSLEASYIGAEVEAYNGNHAISSQLILNDNELRFCLDNGVMLMYDYFFHQWTTIPAVNAVACATFQNYFCYVQSDGIVLQENPTIWTHNGNFRRIKLTTCWLSIAQLQGFQRVYKTLILGTYVSPHKLKVNVAINFNPSFVQEDYINASTLLANPAFGLDGAFGNGTPFGGNSQVYQWRVFNKYQKCESVQYTIEEIPLQPYGEGVRLSGLTLEVAGKKGAFKVAPANSVG